jgi:GT2 family glycosyltransferase
VESVDERADVIVTDNDPDRSAETVTGAHSVGAVYLAEPEPGIASARNRGLEHFAAGYEAIIFLDDDEWVEPTWFATMTGFLESHDAGVVQGPVLTVLPSDAPDWVRKGGFYQRRLREDGQELPSAATNNTALRHTAWKAAGSPRFDPAFSTTGGSDWDFFWGVRKAGATIRYCADAIASEDVPTGRLTRKWIAQRYVRNGIVEIRVMRKHREPLARFVILALASAVVGAAQLAVGLVLGRGLQARPLSRVLIPYGKITGLLGHRIQEYKRSS